MLKALPVSMGAEMALGPIKNWRRWPCGQGLETTGGDTIIMSKKLFTGLLPLLALAAFALAPAMAQATECKDPFEGATSTTGPCAHFWRTTKIATIPSATGVGTSNGYTNSSKTRTLAWGGLTLTSAAGVIHCQNVVLAREWNPAKIGATVETPAGKDETLSFQSDECEDETCPVEATVTPVALPWLSELVGEEPNIRDESRGVKVKIGCGPESIEFETNAKNKQTPLSLPYISGCNKPGEVDFDAGSGSLEALGEAVIGTTSGSLKTCGYEKQEGLQVKSP
jgi:hypothetical protein